MPVRSSPTASPSYIGRRSERLREVKLLPRPKSRETRLFEPQQLREHRVLKCLKIVAPGWAAAKRGLARSCPNVRRFINSGLVPAVYAPKPITKSPRTLFLQLKFLGFDCQHRAIQQFGQLTIRQGANQLQFIFRPFVRFSGQQISPLPPFSSLVFPGLRFRPLLDFSQSCAVHRAHQILAVFPLSRHLGPGFIGPCELHTAPKKPGASSR